ncbi:MAG: flagellar protein FlaG [Bryobacteraceae bacterium]|nr:flagellar protein FlaG [Bryobacteraceae bacterium]
MEVGPVDPKIIVAGVPVSNVPEEVRAEQRQLIQAVKAVNEANLFGNSNELAFSVDRQTRRVVTRLVDVKTREVIRQIPEETVLKLARQLMENQQE